MTPRERCIRVLLKVLADPYRYTISELSQQLDQASQEGVKSDLGALKACGLTVEYKIRDGYRYAILPDAGFRELTYLQPLSAADRAKISRALDYLSSKDNIYLQRKLESLYDFQQLGLRALRRPALDRIDRLETARKQRRLAVLENYRSNSGTVRDREVEPFFVDAELDTLQAYDVEEESTRHFLLSRIDRVRILDLPWSHEEDHRFQKTDVFRIANNRQVLVQLKLDVYAYNALVGAYPKALSEIEPGGQPLTYEFQSMVNEDFVGLSNFILGNAAMSAIEIVGPDRLRTHIQTLAQRIIEKNEKKNELV